MLFGYDIENPCGYVTLCPVYYIKNWTNKVKVTQQIEQILQAFPIGVVFGYSDLISDPNSKQAAIKALNRKAQKGELVKLAKGKFYKPEQSIFGTLKVSEQEIVKDFLQDGEKITGYLTGLSIYSKLGFTTQVSSVIQIAKNNIRPNLQRDYYKIHFVLQKNEITENNVPLLQLLDVIRYIKNIPDTTIEKAIERLTILITALSTEQLVEIKELAKKYPPSVRALLGLILENEKIEAEDLLATLNPISTYNYNIANLFENAKRWGIK